MQILGEVYTSSEKYPGLNLRLEEHENLYYLDPKKLACKTGSGEIKRKLLIEENCFQLVTRKFILESPGNGNFLTILLAYSPSPPWH